ncbi:MAG TPA: tetratricopeptide repeat protein [Vicinamibacteria bacterium]|nr:tetratricopeptide repeat protein [Vicinamibacteria bacterium]
MGDALICSACGTRNRVTWEYCVRCGESLQSLPITMSLAARAADEPEAAPEHPSELPAEFWATATVLLFVGLGFTAWKTAREVPSRPPPGLFTLATLPRELPPPVTQVSASPGAKDFEEGRRLLAQGQAGAAIPLFARAAGDAPSNPQLQSLYGQALWAANLREEALGRYTRAARLDPSRFRLQLARALDAAGRPADANREYQGVLALDPSNPTASEDLGRLLFRGGDFGHASPLLTRAVEARPDDPALRQELAYSLEQSGDTERAVGAYQEVLRRAPEADIARGRLAELFLQQGKTDEALAVVQEGIQRTPQVPILRRDLGSLLERVGRLADAVKEYREYARLAPNAPDAQEVIERSSRLEAGTGS